MTAATPSTPHLDQPCERQRLVTATRESSPATGRTLDLEQLHVKHDSGIPASLQHRPEPPHGRELWWDGGMRASAGRAKKAAVRPRQPKGHNQDSAWAVRGAARRRGCGTKKGIRPTQEVSSTPTRCTIDASGVTLAETYVGGRRLHCGGLVANGRRQHRAALAADMHRPDHLLQTGHDRCRGRGRKDMHTKSTQQHQQAAPTSCPKNWQGQNMQTHSVIVKDLPQSKRRPTLPAVRISGTIASGLSRKDAGVASSHTATGSAAQPASRVSIEPHAA